jgi:hypothetical protein
MEHHQQVGALKKSGEKQAPAMQPIQLLLWEYHY